MDDFNDTNSNSLTVFIRITMTAIWKRIPFFIWFLPCTPIYSYLPINSKTTQIFFYPYSLTYEIKFTDLPSASILLLPHNPLHTAPVPIFHFSLFITYYPTYASLSNPIDPHSLCSITICYSLNILTVLFLFDFKLCILYPTYILYGADYFNNISL